MNHYTVSPPPSNVSTHTHTQMQPPWCLTHMPTPPQSIMGFPEGRKTDGMLVLGATTHPRPQERLPPCIPGKKKRNQISGI